jgi:hypothetical protein
MQTGLPSRPLATSRATPQAVPSPSDRSFTRSLSDTHSFDLFEEVIDVSGYQVAVLF